MVVWRSISESRHHHMCTCALAVSVFEYIRRLVQMKMAQVLNPRDAFEKTMFLFHSCVLFLNQGRYSTGSYGSWAGT